MSYVYKMWTSVSLDPSYGSLGHAPREVEHNLVYVFCLVFHLFTITTASLTRCGVCSRPCMNTLLERRRT